MEPAEEETIHTPKKRVRKGKPAARIPATQVEILPPAGGLGGSTPDGLLRLVGEIGMMRDVMRRVYEQAQEEAADLDAWALALSTLGLASTRLAQLLRAEQELNGKQSEEAGALSRALSAVIREQMGGR